jgi:hypothetical protein
MPRMRRAKVMALFVLMRILASCDYGRGMLSLAASLCEQQ